MGKFNKAWCCCSDSQQRTLRSFATISIPKKESNLIKPPLTTLSLHAYSSTVSLCMVVPRGYMNKRPCLCECSVLVFYNVWSTCGWKNPLVSPPLSTHPRPKNSLLFTLGNHSKSVEESSCLQHHLCHVACLFAANVKGETLDHRQNNAQKTLTSAKQVSCNQ